MDPLHGIIEIPARAGIFIIKLTHKIQSPCCEMIFIGTNYEKGTANQLRPMGKAIVS